MPRILLTGATGYVGGRLVPLLLEAGYRVRCLVRTPMKLRDRPWRHHPLVEVVESDLSAGETLTRALEGCDVAYYLVHSMIASGGKYAEQDRQLATHFAEAATAAGVSRIIYLGGLGEMGDNLSEHLSSRREVEQVLRDSGIPLTVFRAAMIIGSGSASFEILRYLVERLPVMITPGWVRTECQPVAIRDVLHWLVECLRVPATAGEILEIGGPEVISYADLMQVAAEELGLRKRVLLPVPLLTPRLSSAWISLVTPVSFRISRPLAEGLRNRVVVTDNRVAELMPRETLGVREAIRRALARTIDGQVETRWSAAGPIPGDPDWAGGTVFTDRRSIVIRADAARVFQAICRVGGGHGWYAGDILWRIRGWMDQAVGGPGLRRGRRHPENVEFGEALDFWRVVGLEKNRELKLLAEMKLPGIARLEFQIEPATDSDEDSDPNSKLASAPDLTCQRQRLIMTARFRPRGLAGLAYWYSVVPLHHFVFGGMLQGIRRAAEQPEPTPSSA